MTSLLEECSLSLYFLRSKTKFVCDLSFGVNWVHFSEKIACFHAKFGWLAPDLSIGIFVQLSTNSRTPNNFVLYFKPAVIKFLSPKHVRAGITEGNHKIGRQWFLSRNCNTFQTFRKQDVIFPTNSKIPIVMVIGNTQSFR